MLRRIAAFNSSSSEVPTSDRIDSSKMCIRDSCHCIVVMSNELYVKFTKMNRIDQAIFESEKELEETGVSIDLDQTFEKLNKKYYG